MNTVHRFQLRLLHNIYVFSDPRFGLVDEPFLQRSSGMLDYLAMRHHLRPEQPFVLLASASSFPDSHAYPFIREEDGGWIYCDKPAGIYFCLSPALLHYFPAPPPLLYVSAETADAPTAPDASHV